MSVSWGWSLLPWNFVKLIATWLFSITKFILAGSGWHVAAAVVRQLLCCSTIFFILCSKRQQKALTKSLSLRQPPSQTLLSKADGLGVQLETSHGRLIITSDKKPPSASHAFTNCTTWTSKTQTKRNPNYVVTFYNLLCAAHPHVDDPQNWAVVSVSWWGNWAWPWEVGLKASLNGASLPVCPFLLGCQVTPGSCLYFWKSCGLFPCSLQPRPVRLSSCALPQGDLLLSHSWEEGWPADSKLAWCWWALGFVTVVKHTSFDSCLCMEKKHRWLTVSYLFLLLIFFAYDRWDLDVFF